MFFGNSRKILLAAATISIFSAACRFWQKAETSASNQNSSAVNQETLAVPFPSKEPETYQAEIVTETYAGDEKNERKTFTARSGRRRLTIFNLGEKNEISTLEYGDAELSLLSFPAKRIYAENKIAPNGSVDSPGDFLTNEWLNAESSASFEKLETENDLTKFRVRLNDAGKSEVLIYFDENLKIPVRQEFYSVTAEQRTLTYAVEVKNFRLEADENLFAPPKDFRKVSLDDFQQIVRREK